MFQVRVTSPHGWQVRLESWEAVLTSYWLIIAILGARNFFIWRFLGHLFLFILTFYMSICWTLGCKVENSKAHDREIKFSIIRHRDKQGLASIRLSNNLSWDMCSFSESFSKVCDQCSNVSLDLWCVNFIFHQNWLVRMCCVVRVWAVWTFIAFFKKNLNICTPNWQLPEKKSTYGGKDFSFVA